MNFSPFQTIQEMGGDSNFVSSLKSIKGNRMNLPIEQASAVFIILTWNSEKYINKCLNSVSSLPFKRLTIFVVDNGSSDMSKVLTQNIAQKNASIKLIPLDCNMGTTKSRNIALKKIPESTDYVCILDSDTEVNSDAFTTMVQHLQQDVNHSIGIIGPRMHNANGEYQLTGRNLPTGKIKLLKASPFVRLKQKGSSLEIPKTKVMNELQDVPYLLSACWFMPYSTIKKVGLLDEAIFYAPEDVDYCVRVHKAGLRVVTCSDADIMHDYQRISQHKLFSATNFEHIKGLLYYFKKYHYFFNTKKVL